MHLALDHFQEFPLAPHLAVAVSGGADSMACALLAAAWAAPRGVRLTALTVDHGLRTESAAEAAQVAVWMRERGISHHILTPPPQHHSNNLQENARQRRYDALAQWCRAHAVGCCLVAHHAQDQAETVALHTARGDTADGASGMSAVRRYRDVWFLRPLLATRRDRLRLYLQQQQAAWIEDPSNRNRQFARVRIREALAADPEALTDYLAQALVAGQERAARAKAVAEWASRCVGVHPAGYAEMNVSIWCGAPEALANQLLADTLTAIGGRTARPRRAETERLAAALRSSAPRRTLHGCMVEVLVDAVTLRISREAARVAPPIRLSGEGHTRWDDRFAVTYRLPEPESVTLGALAACPHRSQRLCGLPLSTPVAWNDHEVQALPSFLAEETPRIGDGWVQIRFDPAKPLAATPFWCLKEDLLLSNKD